MSTTSYVDVENTIQNIDQNPNVPAEDTAAIQEFVDHCAAEGINEVRQQRLASALKPITTKFAGDGFTLRGASEGELKQLVASLNRSDYADSTKHTWRSAV
jgi:hypothetical protein